MGACLSRMRLRSARSCSRRHRGDQEKTHRVAVVLSSSRGSQVLAWQAVSLAPRREFPLPETPRSMALVPGDADASGGSAGPKVKTGQGYRQLTHACERFAEFWQYPHACRMLHHRQACFPPAHVRAPRVVVPCWHVRVDALVGKAWQDQVDGSREGVVRRSTSPIASRCGSFWRVCPCTLCDFDCPSASPVHVSTSLRSWYFPCARSTAWWTQPPERLVLPSCFPTATSWTPALPPQCKGEDDVNLFSLLVAPRKSEVANEPHGYRLLSFTTRILKVLPLNSSRRVLLSKQYKCHAFWVG